MDDGELEACYREASLEVDDAFEKTTSDGFEEFDNRLPCFA